jgi:N-acetylmuramoyl-L-alanine amidase
MPPIEKVYSSPNFDERPPGVDVTVLVIHYTGLRTCQEALDRLSNPRTEVSSHYLISKFGEIYLLVPEDKRAWHAGVSYWRGNSDVNACSIGIELENPGHEFGYQDFSISQMNALIELSQEILSRHPIPARNVVGHSDVAPRRKQDPGELFDWKFMADHGIGLWPTSGDDEVLHDDVEILLSYLGYETDDIGATLTAFQRHYVPSSISGHLDSLTCKAINSLIQLIR